MSLVGLSVAEVTVAAVCSAAAAAAMGLREEAAADAAQRVEAEGEEPLFGGDGGDALGEVAALKAEGETPVFGSDKAATAAEAKLLDASTLEPGQSLVRRDLRGWMLRGDFSGRDFEGANLDGADLRRAVARCANFRNASMRGVDASRADFRGASLAGVAVHGARLRRTKCHRTRMAGMWSGPFTKARHEVNAAKDGTMPPMEPLGATDEEAVKWAKEEATPVDTAKDEEEDTQDEAAWTVYKQGWKDKGISEELVATLVDMQHMDAT